MSGELLFVLTACRYPGGMLDRTRSSTCDDAGHYSAADLVLHQLERWFHQHPGRLLLHTGDSIYVDATAGLLDPALQDLAGAWRSSDHESYLGFPVRALRKVLMDDHEVGDNWEPSLSPLHDERLQLQMREARDAFLQNTRVNPRVQWLWQTCALAGGREVFLGDTRSERAPRSPERLPTAHIMQAAQREALEAFLLDVHARAPNQFKFVATPSAVLPRRRATAEDPQQALRSDAWDGYPASLEWLLAFVADHGIHNLVFLSGDEHLASQTTIDICGPGGNTVRAYSVHAGGVYAPWPFANAVPEELAGTESFGFRRLARGTAQDYVVHVDTWFAPPRDGFLALCLQQHDGLPEQLSVALHDGRGRVHPFPAPMQAV